MRTFIYSKNIKLIIFDFDGTLYSSKKYFRAYKNYFLNFICSTKNITYKDFRKTLKSKKVFLNKKSSLTSLLQFFNIDMSVWNNFRDKNTLKVSFRDFLAIDNSLLQKYSKRFEIILLTNKTSKNLHIFSKNLNIDLTLFKKVFTADDAFFSKEDCFKLVKKEFNYSFTEILSIGNNYKTDVKEMVGLGGNAVLVKNIKDLEKIYCLIQ